MDTPTPDTPQAPAPPGVVIQPLCEEHRTDLLARRLNLSPFDPWEIAEMACGLLLAQRAMADPRIIARADRDANNLSPVLAEIGCMACWEPDWLDAAAKVLAKGTSHALLVANGATTDADWVAPS